MRPTFILAPLAMLLVSSCEPDGGTAASGSGAPHDADKEKKRLIPRNTANPERIAAENSLGRAPEPRNLTTNVEDVCPVHHEKMRIREIPIVFVEPSADGSAPAVRPPNAAFPFGAEEIRSTANRLLPGEALTARVYVCESCVAARKPAEEERRRRGEK